MLCIHFLLGKGQDWYLRKSKQEKKVNATNYQSQFDPGIFADMAFTTLVSTTFISQWRFLTVLLIFLGFSFTFSYFQTLSTFFLLHVETNHAHAHTSKVVNNLRKKNNLLTWCSLLAKYGSNQCLQTDLQIICAEYFQVLITASAAGNNKTSVLEAKRHCYRHSFAGMPSRLSDQSLRISTCSISLPYFLICFCL